MYNEPLMQKQNICTYNHAEAWSLTLYVKITKQNTYNSTLQNQMNQSQMYLQVYMYKLSSWLTKTLARSS